VLNCLLKHYSSLYYQNVSFYNIKLCI